MCFAVSVIERALPYLNCRVTSSFDADIGLCVWSEANLTAFVPPVVAAGLTVAELKESLGRQTW